MMEKKGIPISKKYTMQDDVHEMQFEYVRARQEEKLQDKVCKYWNTFSALNTFGTLIVNMR